MAKKIEKYFFIIILLVIILGLGLRVIGLNKGIWLDEFISIDKISDTNFIQALRTDNQPPTYFILLRLWSTISKQEAFLRIPSIMFGLASIVLLMLWLKPKSYYASSLAGFMIATMPIFIRYSQEIRGYSLLVLATVASFLSADKIAKEHDLIWYCLLAISLTIASTTHLIGLMLLPSVGLYLLFIFSQSNSKVPWLKVVVVFTIPILFYFAIYFFFFQNLYGQNWWMPPLTSQLFISQFRYVFGIDKLYYPSIVLGSLSRNLALLYMPALTTLIIIISLLMVVFGNWKKSYNLLLSAVVYWIQIILVSIVFIPIFWYRTLLLGIVPFIGFVAIQTTSVKNKLIRSFSALGVVAIFLILATGWYFLESRNPIEQWRQAAQFLKTETVPTDIFVFYPQAARGPIMYYSDLIPEENEITLDLQFDLDEFASRITEKVNRLGKERKPVSIFLIVRESINVLNQRDRYNNLLDYLNLISENNSLVGDYGIIQIYFFENLNR